jgi:predicted ribosome quality control (RQC) complex YloA/Tae2 family protein
MIAEEDQEMREASEAQPPTRAQLPDVAKLTGIPERTLQHWFREYSGYRSRRGYPVQLILDVLREHEWDGDPSLLLQGAAEPSAPSDAIERRAPQLAALLQEQEGRLGELAEQQRRLSDALTAQHERQTAIEQALLRELHELQRQATQTAALNELRGLREDVIALRASQQQTDQVQRALADSLLRLNATLASQRRRWWQFWR